MDISEPPRSAGFGRPIIGRILDGPSGQSEAEVEAEAEG